MKKTALALLLLLAGVLPGCLLPEDETALPNTPGAYDVQVEDIGNAGNGTDLRVSFQVPQAAAGVLTDFRLMVVPSEDAVGFTLANAALLEEGRYIKAELNNTSSTTSFTAEARDINGQLIVEETPYRIYVYTLADGEQFKNDHLSFPSFEFVLDDRPDPALSVSSLDAGNDTDAGDIFVQFQQPNDRRGVSGYRIMIVPEDALSSFDFNRADRVPAERYLFQPVVEENEINLTLPETLSDVNGNPILDDVPYRIVVLTLANGVESLSNNLTFAFRPVTLAIASYVRTLGDAFNGDGAMALGPDGFLYVSEAANSLTIPQGYRIWKINTETGERSLFSDQVFAPLSLTIGGGYLYCSSFFEGEVYRFLLSDPNPMPELYYKFRWRPSYMQWRGSVYAHDPRAGQMIRIGFRGPEPPPMDSLHVEVTYDPFPELEQYLAFYFFGEQIFAVNYESSNIVEIRPSAGFGDGGSVRQYISLSGTVGGLAPYRLGTVATLRNKHQVVYYNTAKQEARLAGTGIPGKNDGPPLEASFSYPREVVQGPEGNVYYVQDRANPAASPDDIGPVVIRKIVFVN